MDVQAFEVLKIIVGSAGFLGIGTGVMIMVFRTGKIVQKIEDMVRKFEILEDKVDKLEQKMTERFKEMDDRFRKLEDNFPVINIAITRLEVRLEERTLKMIDIPKKEASS
ncbi:MAG: hypothetical protein WA347_05325 [Rhabdochlamydiaceae bacterium]